MRVLGVVLVYSRVLRRFSGVLQGFNRGRLSCVFRGVLGRLQCCFKVVSGDSRIV